jgi:hypothetical protein
VGLCNWTDYSASPSICSGYAQICHVTARHMPEKMLLAIEISEGLSTLALHMKVL